MRTQTAARTVLCRSKNGRAVTLARRLAWRALIIIKPITRLAWLHVEERFKRRHTPLPIETPHGLVRAYPAVYEDRPIMLLNGRELLYDLPILDLHFDSRTAAKLGAAEGGGNGFFRAGMEDLAAIAEYLANLEYPTYAAVHARTILQNLLLRARADVRERPRTFLTRLEQLFQEMAVIIFHSDQPYEYLLAHHAPIADAWYTMEEMLALSQKAKRKAPA